MSLALANDPGEDRRIVDISSAIANSALFEGASGKQLLALHPASERLIQYDIPKAIFAAAGVLGVSIPLLAGPVGVVSVLSAISALGALQGLRTRLPRACAQLVQCLLPQKMMARKDLKLEFESLLAGSEDWSEGLFEKTLERLEEIGSIRIRNNKVELVERVLVRT